MLESMRNAANSWLAKLLLGLVALSFISWGAQLGTAQNFVREAWWMSVFPGVAITLTVLACNLVADTTSERRTA